MPKLHKQGCRKSGLHAVLLNLKRDNVLGQTACCFAVCLGILLQMRLCFAADDMLNINGNGAKTTCGGVTISR